MGIETENNSNRVLMQDLILIEDAVFNGIYRTIDNYLLVCGHYRVPFLLNLPNATKSHLVTSELYVVSRQGLSKLDELEGTSGITTRGCR
uniref:Gamma-glutamylcyclotransferase family protein n=1 Tax=Populus trichocarpa TaxID=3694 RepID=U5GLG3_POPTR